MHRPPSWPGAAATLVLLVVLAGCTRGEQDIAQTPRNPTDVLFAQQMANHDEQAIEMARFAESRASASSVKDLARAIMDQRRAELGTLDAQLESWGNDVPRDGTDHERMSDSQLPGVLSDQQMERLRGSSGAAFDALLLRFMRFHDAGAQALARDEMKMGKSKQAKSLAAKIDHAAAARMATAQALARSLGVSWRPCRSPASESEGGRHVWSSCPVP